ncbi:F-box domain-containing protein [Mycena chlorophos]|uniref:F-box domain-containing protein n=1 Tax=Mycena chlorophos TaxID=658473 RepID=A0A8H6W5F3_MYCCL|nr:F-box domain-containing protein [Mycena chlorophos]
MRDDDCLLAIVDRFRVRRMRIRPANATVDGRENVTVFVLERFALRDAGSESFRLSEGNVIGEFDTVCGVNAVVGVVIDGCKPLPDARTVPLVNVLRLWDDVVVVVVGVALDAAPSEGKVGNGFGMDNGGRSPASRKPQLHQQPAAPVARAASTAFAKPASQSAPADRVADALGGILEDVALGFSQGVHISNPDDVVQQRLDSDIDMFLACVDLQRLTSLRRFQFHAQPLDIVHSRDNKGKRTFTYRLLPGMLTSLSAIQCLDEVTIRLAFNKWIRPSECPAATQLDALGEWSELDAALLRLESVSRLLFLATFERTLWPPPGRREPQNVKFDMRKVYEEVLALVPMRIPRTVEGRGNALSFAAQMPIGHK